MGEPHSEVMRLEIEARREEARRRAAKRQAEEAEQAHGETPGGRRLRLLKERVRARIATQRG